MNVCPYCKNKLPMAKAFCSREHKKLFFQIGTISMPKQYIKSLVFFTDEKLITKKLEDFSKRHNFDIQIVKKKFNEQLKLYYPDQYENFKQINI